MKTHSRPKKALIVGANSAIARALIHTYASNTETVVAVTRDAKRLRDELPAPQDSLQLYETDYSETSLQSLFQMFTSEHFTFENVFIFNGLLHNQQLKPEKNIESISYENMLAVMTVNAVVPALILSQLTPVLKNSNNCYVVVLSARVGSISDNKLGGWYSYRASKAALNMVIKTASIEFKRRVKDCTLIAFQPGTTKTPLSEPYRKNTPPKKVFSSEYVAKQLYDLKENVEPSNEARFLDYAYQSIPW